LLRLAQTQRPIIGQYQNEAVLCIRRPIFKTRLNDLRATMKLRALVSDLHLQVHFLDRGIHDEEQRTGILDLANIAYPSLARTLRVRRDNLLATIRMLENRMAETDAAA
jgi:hypothetical protein